MATQTVYINFLANATQAQTAINHLGAGINRLQRTTGGANSAFAGMAKGGSALVGVMGAVGAAYTAFGMAVKGASNFVGVNRQFQDAMLELKAVVQEDGGDVAANMAYLEYRARETGKATRYSGVEGAEGLLELAKAGKSAKEAGDMLIPTLHMAQVGGLELGDAAEKLSDVMSAFGKDSAEASDVVDVLAFTAAKSTTDIAQMMESFKYVSAAAGGMNITLRETSIGIGVLSSMGVKASMAGTSLRGTLTQLADSGSRAHRDLLELGLTTEEILPSATNTLIDIMRKARDSGVNASNAYAIFGQRAGIAANVFTQFYTRLEDFDASMENVTGSAERMADTMDSGLTATALKLKNAWSELMIALGKGGTMGALQSVLSSITQGILKMAEAVEVMKTAYSTGTLGELLFLSLKVGIMNAANFLFSHLVLVFKLVAASFMGQLRVLTSASFWEGLFLTFAAVGDMLKGAIIGLEAALLQEIKPFLVALHAGMKFIEDKFIGALLIGGGKFASLLLSATVKILEKFRTIGEFLNIDMDKAISALEDGREWAEGVAEDGQDRRDKTWGATADESDLIVQEHIDGLRQSSQGFLDRANDSVQKGVPLLLDSLKQNYVDPMAEVVKNHEATDIFDVSGATSELAKVYADNLAPPPVAPDESGAMSGADAPVSPNQGATVRALAGANASAINAIMGRTANELIAQESAQQTKLLKQNLDESKQIKKELKELNAKKPAQGYATFQ